MTYDVCLVSDSGPRSIAKRVLVFTDPDAADEVAGAINAVSASLFQAEGLRAEVVPSHRDGTAETPGATEVRVDAPWDSGSLTTGEVPDEDDEADEGAHEADSE